MHEVQWISTYTWFFLRLGCMLVSYTPLAAFCAPVPFRGIRASTLHATAQKQTDCNPRAAPRTDGGARLPGGPPPGQFHAPGL